MLVFTSCTNNYIPKARILASTLKSFHPEWVFCLLLGESPPKDFDLDEEPFDRFLGFEQLGIAGYQSWLFRHRVVEICTAAKGPALFHFLVREAHEKVMYLDPDIMVCNTLEPLEKLLDAHDVLLTPHQLAPQETQQSIVDNELCAMQYGVFNLGFTAVARRGDGLRFARWWRDRLLHYCYDDIQKGLFTDQRWCDLAPAFFPNLHIVRDPGCNAASWNLTDRTITRDGNGIFFANDGPLRFYHFTGFDSGAGDGMTARYAKDMPAVHELWALYRERLVSSGQTSLGQLRWEHTSFADGTPITDSMRFCYREREDVRKAFPDPFVRPGFLEWYHAEQTSKKSLSLGLRHKSRAIFWRTKILLDHHGGFPKGLPGMTAQTAAWLKKWGIMGVIKKIWSSSRDAVHAVEELPLLKKELENSESAFFHLFDEPPSSICVIEHDWGGGADAYCRERVAALVRDGFTVIRLRYRLNAGRVEMTVCRRDTYSRYEVSDLMDLADSLFPRIDAIIINELAGWHFDYDFNKTVPLVMETVRAIISVAQHHMAKIEFLFHDYYAVCPTINLLTPEGRYCGLTGTEEQCGVCALRGKPFSIRQWRSVWGDLLNLAEEVVFFSEDTCAAVRKLFPLREEQVRIRPHDVRPMGPPLRIPKDGPMRIAVVGNIQEHKGANFVVGLGYFLEKHMPEASIIVFGQLDVQCTPSNVTVLGAYTREELPELLARHAITVGFFPSVWPETFSFVVHELASVHLPLVCFDLGAQAAYVRTLTNSRVASDISVEAAFAALKELDAARLSA